MYCYCRSQQWCVRSTMPCRACHARHAQHSLFNDVICREAMAARVAVVDLRALLQEADDYSAISPIEPSVKGGEKIAQALTTMLR